MNIDFDQFWLTISLRPQPIDPKVAEDILLRLKIVGPGWGYSRNEEPYPPTGLNLTFVGVDQEWDGLNVQLTRWQFTVAHGPYTVSPADTLAFDVVSRYCTAFPVEYNQWQTTFRYMVQVPGDAELFHTLTGNPVLNIGGRHELEGGSLKLYLEGHKGTPRYTIHLATAYAPGVPVRTWTDGNPLVAEVAVERWDFDEPVPLEERAKQLVVDKETGQQVLRAYLESVIERAKL